MGEPPQALSTEPFPTPFVSALPTFPPPDPTSGGLRDHRPQPHIPGPGPSYIPQPPTLSSCCDHPQPPLAPPEPASVYGTEPQWKEEQWPSICPRFLSLGWELGIRGRIGGWASLGQWPTHVLTGYGQAPQNPGKGGKHVHTSLRATLHSRSPAGGDFRAAHQSPMLWAP